MCICELRKDIFLNCLIFPFREKTTRHIALAMILMFTDLPLEKQTAEIIQRSILPFVHGTEKNKRTRRELASTLITRSQTVTVIDGLGYMLISQAYGAHKRKRRTGYRRIDQDTYYDLILKLNRRSPIFTQHSAQNKRYHMGVLGIARTPTSL